MGHGRHLRSGKNNLLEGRLDARPGLGKVERQRANTMALHNELDGEIARSARVEQNALGLLPAVLAGLLTQVFESLI